MSFKEEVVKYLLKKRKNTQVILFTFEHLKTVLYFMKRTCQLFFQYFGWNPISLISNHKTKNNQNIWQLRIRKIFSEIESLSLILYIYGQGVEWQMKLKSDRWSQEGVFFPLYNFLQILFLKKF